MSLGELGAFISEHLKKYGIDVVLSGGACVSIYSKNKYASYDLDFINHLFHQRRKIKKALLEIEFYEENRYFKHCETDYFVEFPSGPLAVGEEPVKEIITLEFETGKLSLLSPTECIKDRLTGYYHWDDQQCLEQAILVSEANEIDLEEIKRWSKHEGKEKDFQHITNLLTH